MEVHTIGFKGGRKNTQFKCGMFVKPYTQHNQCSNLGIALVTDETYLAYKQYWRTWAIGRENYDLPMLHIKIICQDHIDQLRGLPILPVKEPKQRRTK